MKWIGLTGGIASGKSTVSRILRQCGLPVVDADELAKAVVAPGSLGLRQVVSRFGKEILSPDGNLDRKKLGRLVFGRPDELAALERILHPLVQEQTSRLKKELEKQGHPVAFYDVPLLFEKNLEAQFDGIIVVAADEGLQRSRMRDRDALSDDEISKRLSAQRPLIEKINRATWVLHNNGSIDDLELATANLIEKLKSF